MKRHGNLFEKIASFDNLYWASREARRGKRMKEGTAAFEMNLEQELVCLREELLEKRYRPGPYREFTIYDRKQRKISAAPYRDRVVHHAICQVVEPIFDRTFIHDAYACRVGKGTHRAVDRFTEFARRNRYVLKTDLRKYFPSMDHVILCGKIERKIKCPGTLWLIRLIIDGSNPQEEIVQYFPGDDLFEPFRRRRGIPIGNLTSQFFANLYLNDFDHFVKESLRCRHYLRYVDDITVFGDDKAWLWNVKRRMEDFLDRERLSLHENKTLVIPVAEGVDHLGYRVFPDHRRLRKDNAYRFARKLKKLQRLYGEGRVALKEIDASVQSWIGHARHADTWGLRRRILEEVSFSRHAG